MMGKLRNQGFTLIELLVVISILGLLSATILVTANSVRSKSRDAKRVADLAAITRGLELYFSDFGRYPNHSLEDYNYNWYYLIGDLRLQHYVASEESGMARLWKAVASVIPHALASGGATLAPSPGIQDPQYPGGGVYQSYGYITAQNPAYQGYRLRAKLENLNSPSLQYGLSGSFMYDGVTTGDDSCDKSLGYYCIGTGGTFDTWY